MTDTSARWAILGPGVISANFADALIEADLGHLHAVASRDADRAAAFAATYGATVSGSYRDILAREDIDAVYIGTVHSTHAELAIAALRAGKAVLCEKPLGVDLAQTEAMIETAAEVGLPLVEAFKYRFGPFPERLFELLRSGELGRITRLDSQLGFDAGERTGRLFDPDAAGGTILDVGCYPVSLAVAVADAAGIDAPLTVAASSGIVDAVDERAAATLVAGDFTAEIRTAITEHLPRTAVITCTEGRLVVENVWGSRVASNDVARIERPDGSFEQLHLPVVNPMAAEADATVRALRAGQSQVDEMPWAQSLQVAHLLQTWRAALEPGSAEFSI